MSIWRYLPNEAPAPETGETIEFDAAPFRGM